MQIVGLTVAVWNVFLIGEEKNLRIGQPIAHAAQDGQAAESGIEEADHAIARFP
jgi:hypothetical protein